MLNDTLGDEVEVQTEMQVEAPLILHTGEGVAVNHAFLNLYSWAL